MEKDFELPRKSIHLLSLFVPLCANYSLLATQIGIVCFAIFYSFSEWAKLKNRPFPLQSLIIKMQREREKKRFARAPLFLAIGVLAAISFFSFKAALVGIYLAGFCDTMAALSGKKWGETKLPLMKRKTYAGSGAFFLTSLPMTFYFLPPSKAIIVSLVGAFLESLPFKDWDNLTVPLVVSFLVEQYLFS